MAGGGPCGRSLPRAAAGAGASERSPPGERSCWECGPACGRSLPGAGAGVWPVSAGDARRARESIGRRERLDG